MSPPQDSLTRHEPADATMQMQLQVLGQIRDSLALMHKKQERISEDVSSINVRVVKLEERDERLERAERAVVALDSKIDVLMTDKSKREGASSVFVGIRGWTPVIIAIIAALCSVFSGLYLAGRATGVVQAPPGGSAIGAPAVPPRHADHANDGSAT